MHTHARTHAQKEYLAAVSSLGLRRQRRRLGGSFESIRLVDPIKTPLSLCMSWIVSGLDPYRAGVDRYQRADTAHDAEMARHGRLESSTS